MLNLVNTLPQNHATLNTITNTIKSHSVKWVSCPLFGTSRQMSSNKTIMDAGFTSSDPSFPATSDDENSDDTDKQSQLTGIFTVEV